MLGIYKLTKSLHLHTVNAVIIKISKMNKQNTQRRNE